MEIIKDTARKRFEAAGIFFTKAYGNLESTKSNPKVRLTGQEAVTRIQIESEPQNPEGFQRATGVLGALIGAPDLMQVCRDSLQRGKGFVGHCHGSVKLSLLISAVEFVLVAE